jgi:ubiquinone/menaquinone biosynthesis C-methylase UbiE
MTTPRDLRDFYDRETTAIERYSSKDFWASRYHNKRMSILQNIMRHSFEKCNSFLDVGCGTGEYLSFARNLAGCVCGLDLSMRYIERCKSDKANSLILGDFRLLPFRNCAFEYVLCSEVIEHTNDQSEAIHEILRVSSKSVLISTPNHGIFRRFLSRVRPKQLKLIDERVGHVAILKFPDLLNKFNHQDWRVAIAFTAHVFPPALDEIRIPRIVAPLIGLAERLMDKLMPFMGSISIIYLESINSK